MCGNIGRENEIRGEMLLNNDKAIVNNRLYYVENQRSLLIPFGKDNVRPNKCAYFFKKTFIIYIRERL